MDEKDKRGTLPLTKNRRSVLLAGVLVLALCLCLAGATLHGNNDSKTPDNSLQNNSNSEIPDNSLQNNSVKIVFEVDGNRFEITSQESNEVQIIDTYNTNLIIPDKVNSDGVEYTVVAIKEKAFSGFNITSVQIPLSVTSMGDYAFSDSDVNSVDLSKALNLKRIPTGAFMNTKISQITIPGNVETISTESFSGCSNLKSINLGEGILNMEASAFKGIPIVELVIPDSVTYLGPGVFSDCVNLKSLSIPVSLNAVAESLYPAFDNCNSLTEFTFTAGTGDGFNYSADSDYYSADSDFHYYNDHVKNAPWQVNMDSVHKVTLAQGVKSIGTHMFYTMTSLQEVILPDTLQVLGGSCFGGCNGLTKIDLSHCKDLKSINHAAFGMCLNLDDIVIPDVEMIGSYAFIGCGVETAYVGNVNTIDTGAFMDCKHLINVVIEDVEKIGDSVFEDCAELKTVVLKDVDTMELGSGVFHRANSDACFIDLSNTEIKMYEDEERTTLVEDHFLNEVGYGYIRVYFGTLSE